MAKLMIQGKSANNSMNKGPKKTPPKLQIQGAGANYEGQQVSKSRTPYPPAKPYPPIKTSPMR